MAFQITLPQVFTIDCNLICSGFLLSKKEKNYLLKNGMPSNENKLINKYIDLTLSISREEKNPNKKQTMKCIRFAIAILTALWFKVGCKFTIEYANSSIFLSIFFFHSI